MNKYWRRFNTTLFLVAFLAPWLRSCDTSSNTLNGFQSTIFLGFIFSINLGASEEKQLQFLVLLIFIGLICVLLYSLINLVFSFGFTTKMISGLRVSILIIGMLGMLASLPWAKLSDTDLKDFLWGYWLTWIGLFSSLASELTETGVGTIHATDQ